VDIPIKSPIITGTIWVIKDPETGGFIDNIDTEMIYDSAYMDFYDEYEMGMYTFSGLKGWENFSDLAQPGDIIAAGENFGAGLSKPHAIHCFKGLGISLIIAQSFGAVYKKHAIRSGLPVITYPRIKEVGLETGNVIEVYLETGTIKNISKMKVLPPAEPFSRVQMEIFQAAIF
jgi:3-isopropylmalate dehydratase small subunit